MSSALQVNTGWLVGAIISTVFVIVYPLVLGLIARLRLKVSWRYFWYGALVFLVFQMLTRIPLVLWIQGLIAPQLKASVALQYGWVAILALTAGLFEEVGRYVGYRWLMRREEKTWSKGVMYGIGHGGLESILLVGVSLLLTVINLIALPSVGISSLPAAQQAAVTQQIATINAQPAWTSLLGGWERLWTVPFHIAMSVIVLQVFRRGSLLWLGLAILLHALLDFMAAGLPLALGSSISTSLTIEGIIAIVGLLSIWAIWRLRDDTIAETPSIPVGSDGDTGEPAVLPE